MHPSRRPPQPIPASTDKSPRKLDSLTNKQTNKNLRCGNRKGLLGRNDQTHHRMGPKTMDATPPINRSKYQTTIHHDLEAGHFTRPPHQGPQNSDVLNYDNSDNHCKSCNLYRVASSKTPLSGWHVCTHHQTNKGVATQQIKPILTFGSKTLSSEYRCWHEITRNHQNWALQRLLYEVALFGPR